MRSVFRQLIERQAIKPYIAGHVTDGSTVTFKINGDSNITVDVDSNGNFKWIADRNITSLEKAFNNVVDVDKVFIQLPLNNNITSCYYMFDSCADLTDVVIYGDLSKVATANKMFNASKLTSLKISNSFSPKNMEYFAFACTQNINLIFDKSMFKNATTLNRAFMNAFLSLIDLSLSDNCSDFSYIGQNNSYLITLKLPNIKASAIFIAGTCPNLENVEIKSTKSDLDFQKCSKLTKQSILNIINAAAANVTYTLHSTIYNKCASSGEWYTDVQNAIDAKALQGYTVTLISA